jgi:hypothetical protein
MMCASQLSVLSHDVPHQTASSFCTATCVEMFNQPGSLGGSCSHRRIDGTDVSFMGPSRNGCLAGSTPSSLLCYYYISQSLGATQAIRLTFELSRSNPSAKSYHTDHGCGCPRTNPHMNSIFIFAAQFCRRLRMRIGITTRVRWQYCRVQRMPSRGTCSTRRYTLALSCQHTTTTTTLRGQTRRWT